MIAKKVDKNVRICVYGTLKRGYRAHHLLGGSQQFEGTTYLNGFEMISLGSFPGIFKSPDLQQSVYVEVYTVPESQLEALDTYEGAPNFYRREQILTVYGEAFIYTLPDDEKYTSMNRVKTGKWEVGAL